MQRSWWRELWAFREVLYFLVWRDLSIRYKQTVLGVAWAVLQPVLATLIFTVFFGRLAKVPSDGVPYAVFVYSALTAWTFFSTAVVAASNSLVSNQNLISKVYVPRAIIPSAVVLSFVPDFVAASLVLVALMLFYGLPLTFGLLLWPLLLIPLVVLAVGVGLWLAALNVRYRDVKYVVPFVMQMLLFATPIIYPVSLVPEKFRMILALNPLTGLIEAFRATALASQNVNWQLVAAGCGFSVLILILAFAYFRRAERSFADTI